MLYYYFVFIDRYSKMKEKLTFLGIETSCDETAAAVVNSERKILSESIYSQIETHAEYLGVVPELAARSHIDHCSKVIKDAIDFSTVPVQKAA